MNTEEKQEFKSSGLLALLGLMGLSALIIVTPWNRHRVDPRNEEALQKAEVVGYQVVQIYREALASSGVYLDKKTGRIPASAPSEGQRNTGIVGKDPWGQPYRYRILGADQDHKIRILVWSAGANGKVDSQDLDNEDKVLPHQPTYAGDDLGVILSVAQN